MQIRNHIADDGGESISIIEAKGRHPMTKPA
jgi:hypothetical protein